jgi:hypothetical protein
MIKEGHLLLYSLRKGSAPYSALAMYNNLYRKSKAEYQHSNVSTNSKAINLS